MCPLCRIESAGDHQRRRNKNLGAPVRSLRRYHRPADHQEPDSSEEPAHEAAPYTDLWKRPVEEKEATALLTSQVAHSFLSSHRLSAHALDLFQTLWAARNGSIRVWST